MFKYSVNNTHICNNNKYLKYVIITFKNCSNHLYTFWILIYLGQFWKLDSRGQNKYKVDIEK